MSPSLRIRIVEDHDDLADAEQILARLNVESRWQVARALCDTVATDNRET